MTFVNISNTLPSALTFNGAGVGRYVNSAVAFGAPTDYYQLSPARKVKGKPEVTTFSTMRYVEIAPAVAGDPRPYARVNLTVEVHKDMPLVNVDNVIIQLNEFASVANMTRQANGEV